ncbi:hypothetical protein FRX31_005234 [Thalictrum thalictroides]|uniref:Uncharacterized protein n=1 Tax=Thalictrum thalictroides TaxID=46969 RepID=A0A7J6X9K4_THATH|nr:hypothetical protein FRX31_005234 [Thalictrum thalictroides]
MDKISTNATQIESDHPEYNQGELVMFNAFSLYADHLIMGTCNEELDSTTSLGWKEIYRIDCDNNQDSCEGIPYKIFELLFAEANIAPGVLII